MPKAVLSNRIYLEVSESLRESIDKELTYSIPSFSEQQPPLIIKNMGTIRPGLISMPIGRIDLIPKGYEIVEKRVLAPTKFPEFKFPLRASQQEIYDDFSDNAIINASVSWGKAQPPNSRIRVPGGWVTMGEIKLGDKVITPKNTTATIINKYDHISKDIYRLTFLDGRTSEACGEHLWKVYNSSSNTGKLLNTEEIMNKLTTLRPNSLYIDLTNPIEDKASNHIISPYLLGFLLGDGGLTNFVTFSTADVELLDKITSYLPKNHSIKHRSNYDYAISSPLGQPNLILQELDRLKLRGLTSDLKFIPEEYMYDSINNKLELLQGLLDSDGSIELSGKIEFCTTSVKLMEGFSEIIRSLGGTIAVSNRVTTYTYKNEIKNGKVSYRGRPTRLSYDIKKRLFHLSRKLSRVKPGKLDGITKLGIKSVEYIGKSDCSCIELDDTDHLYLTDNYIVTHNTFGGLAIAGKLGQKTLIVTHTIPLRNQWVKETEKVYGFTPSIIGSGKFDMSMPITIGNTQTLYNNIDKISRNFGTVIMDEFHHVSSPTFSRIIDKSFARFKIGLSGTIIRKDGKHVVFRDYFGQKVYQPPKENYMVPEVHLIYTKIRFPDGARTPWALKVNDLVNNEDYRHLVAILASKYAAEGHNVLLVSDRVHFLNTVAKLIGDNAVAVTGAVKNEDRDALIQSIGKTHNVLAGTQAIFSEGMSHSPLSCLILGTPVNNEPLLEQLVGRVVRLLEGKNNPIIVDIQLVGTTANRQANARLGHYIKQGYRIKKIWV